MQKYFIYVNVLVYIKTKLSYLVLTKKKNSCLNKICPTMICTYISNKQ